MMSLQVGLTEAFLLVSPLLSNTCVYTKHAFILHETHNVHSPETISWSVYTAANDYLDWVIWQKCFRDVDNFLVQIMVCEDQNLTGPKLILFY